MSSLASLTIPKSASFTQSTEATKTFLEEPRLYNGAIIIFNWQTSPPDRDARRDALQVGSSPMILV